MVGSDNFKYRPGELISRMDGRVMVFTISREKYFNAWTSALREALAVEINAADSNPDIDAVVITGSGEKAFCSGQDLFELREFADGASIDPWFQRFFVCYEAVRQFGKPIVAALNGTAAGSGFQIAQFCDYVVAHPGVQVGQTEINSGLPSVFGTWLMWERIGRRSIELALQGRLMGAAEAKQLGFIQELAEPSEVVSTAVAVARRLAEQPSTAYRLSKSANLKFDEERFTEAMRMAGEAYRAAFDTGVPQGAIKEFFDKRQARKFSNDAS